MLRVVVLSEGEPSPQSEVLSRFGLRISLYFALFNPINDVATTMFHRRDGARFPPDVTLGIQARVFNLDFVRPDNLVSHSQSL